MKTTYQAPILENIRIADEIYKITMAAPDIAENAIPGQFVHIKIPGDSSLLLRRPISINSVNKQKGIIDLVYQKVGKGTSILSSLQPDEVKIDILGPLGNGYKVPENTRKLCLVGGGCGVAPLKFAAERWMNLDITACLGFRNKPSVYQIEDFQRLCNRVFISTDDGSMGDKGFATNSLIKWIEKQKPDLILGCGPIPMIKTLKNISNKYNIPCQISLEERMGCGIGGCLVCSCAIRVNSSWEYKKVCTDGPVFNSEEVRFDEPAKSLC